MIRIVCLLLLASPIWAAKPNVVLIVIDDLGQRDLGCYGSTYHRTPHLNALAQQGVKLTDAYAICPVCSPTRVALQTGRHPVRVGITDWLPGRDTLPEHRLKRPTLVNQLPLSEVTLAQILKKNGYATAHIGKWHLGGEGHDPTRFGFDVNIAGDHTGTPLSYFAPYRNKQRTMPGLETAPEGEYLTDRLTAECETFIEANAKQPFFLMLNHYAVHTPLKAKPDLQAKYKPGPAGRQGNPIYAAMVESMDESVGKILKKLEELNLTETTLVIFTSDNGGLATQEGPNTPATINAPYREGKGHLYEGGVRVPFILRGPGISTGNMLMTSLDVVPTVLGVCEITSELKFDGENLAPALKGEKPRQGKTVYWHYPHYANQGSRPSGAVRHENWKYIEFYDSGRQELYDISKDVSESRNLAAEKPEIVKDLAAKLDAFRKDTVAKMPTPNPNYKPNPQSADGSILLPGKWADVHGTQLRFEPLPHKNTLGFWTKLDDYATFEFTVEQPGTFEVHLWQGCGHKSGGAEVDVTVGDSKLSFTVKETGGFQVFEERVIGDITIPQAGRHVLTVKPRTKPGVAVMDLPKIKLVKK